MYWNDEDELLELDPCPWDLVRDFEHAKGLHKEVAVILTSLWRHSAPKSAICASGYGDDADDDVLYPYTSYHALRHQNSHYSTMMNVASDSVECSYCQIADDDGNSVWRQLLMMM